MKKIAVLPGSCWQIPIIKKAKKMGYFVLNINPYVDSPAFPFADETVQLDIMDISHCRERMADAKVSAVISDECDIATPVVAKLAELLDLKGIGIESAELFTNKYKMREFTKKNGFAFPQYALTASEEEAENFFHTLQGKMIIKPLDSNSSRGVHTVYSIEDLKDNFSDSLGYSISEKKVICEEYIEGTEFTVDGIMTTAGHSTLAISEKKHYSYNENIAYSLRFSHVNERFDYDLLRKTNDNLLNKTGLPFGLTHVEYKYNNGEFVLIEMGARGGGNLISSDIVPVLSGIDNYDIYIRMALGEKIGELYSIAPQYRKREAILYFFDVPKTGIGCRIKKIEGLDYLENHPNVIAFAMNYQAGERVKRALDDSKRPGYYIAYGNDKEELDCIIAEAEKRVKFVFEE